MSDLHLDDPRLTAYALGELDAAAAGEFARWLADHPAAQAEVAAIRDFGAKLQAELEAEPVSVPTGPRPVTMPAIASPASSANRSRFAVVALAASVVGLAAGVIYIEQRSHLEPLADQPAVAVRHRSEEELARDTKKLTGDLETSIRLREKVPVEEFTDSVDDWDAIKKYSKERSRGPEATKPAEDYTSTTTEGAPQYEVLNGYAESDPASSPGENSARGNKSLRSGLDVEGHSGDADIIAGPAKPKEVRDSTDDKSSPGGSKSGDRTKPIASSTSASPKDLKPEARNSDRLFTEFEIQGGSKPPSGTRPQDPSKMPQRSGQGDKSLAGDDLDGDRPASEGKPGPSSPAPKAGKGIQVEIRDLSGPAEIETESSPDASIIKGVREDGEKVMELTRETEKSGKSRKRGYAKGRTEAGQQNESKSDSLRTGLQQAGKELQDLGESIKEADVNAAVDGLVDETREAKPGVEIARGAVPLSRLSVRGLSTFSDGYYHQPNLGTETYEAGIEQAFLQPAAKPLSTFSIDVDTASYTNVRRFLKQHQLPPAGAVRIEELVNYFRYDDPPPADDKPFSVNVEVARCPWNVGNRLVRIALKAREVKTEKRPAGNLVFLVDVSGSMADANKLPLVRESLKLLVGQLTENDRVAIVTYSDTARVALEATAGNRHAEMNRLIDSLTAGGSTNGAGGLQLAYRVAAQNFSKEGINRVIICTDGDFNVGISADDELVKFIAEKKESGIFLSVFGFGMGNLKDAKLEKLADQGNGHYAYVDDIAEGQRVFVDELAGTLVTVAKDVKAQVEFNPYKVAAYRLIGYDNRRMADQDFRNDAKDAGEIGAGHSVTVLYEIVPVGATVVGQQGVEAFRYRFAVPLQDGLTRPDGQAGKPVDKELFTVRLRAKAPQGDAAVEQEFPVADRPDVAQPSQNFQWASAVAAFGLVLRDSEYRGQASLALAAELAHGSRGEDPTGRRREFIELLHLASRIHGGEPASRPLASRPLTKLSDDEALQKASVNGKYKRLVEKIEVEQDGQSYGEFSDYGYYTGKSYAGHDHLPPGYWVYVYPRWYIWGDVAK